MYLEVVKIMIEWETKSGSRTLNGYWLWSVVRIQAESTEEAFVKLQKCNPGSHIVWPPKKVD